MPCAAENGSFELSSASRSLRPFPQRLILVDSRHRRRILRNVGYLEFTSRSCLTAIGQSQRNERLELCREDSQKRRPPDRNRAGRSAEHTYELQSLMSISYAVFCSQKKNITYYKTHNK